MGFNFLIRVFSFLFSFNVAYASDTLNICSEKAAPYVETDANTGDVIGIDIEVAKEIFKKLNVTYKINETPWTRCENDLKSGEYDMGLKISWNQKREEFLYYIKNQVWTTQFVLFSTDETKKKYKTMTYDDIKSRNLKLGVILENSYNPDFWTAFPWVDKEAQKYHPNIEASANVETNMMKLSKGHIDVYIQDKSIGLYTIKKLGIKGLTFYDNILFKKDYGTVFSRKSKFSTSKYKSIEELSKAYDIELGKFKATKKFENIFKTFLLLNKK